MSEYPNSRSSEARNRARPQAKESPDADEVPSISKERQPRYQHFVVFASVCLIPIIVGFATLLDAARGACCVNNECIVVTRFSCSGFFSGYGTECDASACVSPTPQPTLSPTQEPFLFPTESPPTPPPTLPTPVPTTPQPTPQPTAGVQSIGACCMQTTSADTVCFQDQFEQNCQQLPVVSSVIDESTFESDTDCVTACPGLTVNSHCCQLGTMAAPLCSAGLRRGDCYLLGGYVIDLATCSFGDGACTPLPPTPAPTLSPTLSPTPAPTPAPTINPDYSGACCVDRECYFMRISSCELLDGVFINASTCEDFECPTLAPTASPTPNPTAPPTPNPTPQPPTPNPTPQPTTNPTPNPTPQPTTNPTPNPSPQPTANPTPNPTTPTPEPTTFMRPRFGGFGY